MLPGGDIDLGTWRYRSAGYAVTSGARDLYGIRSRLRRESAAQRIGSGSGASRSPGSHIIVESAGKLERGNVVGRMDEHGGDRPSRSPPATRSTQSCHPATVRAA